MTTMFVYIICSFITYTILNEKLIIVDQKTGGKIDISEEKTNLKFIFEIIKICFSFSWLFSIPYLLISSRDKLD